MITDTFYEQVTGSTAPENLDDLVLTVVARLSSALNRPLAQAERSEWVTVRAGLAFPAATPVVEAEFPHDDLSIEVPERDSARTRVTYTGGYLPIDAEDDTVCPDDLARAIAWGAHTLAADPTMASLPPGVSSMTVAGEFSVTVAAGSALGADGVALPMALASIADLGGRCAQLAAPYRRIAAGV